jgi:hypothetical protein
VDRACSANGEEINTYNILVGKLEGKRPLGRRSRRWVNNIKMDLREIVWRDMDWFDLSKDRDQWRALVNTVMYFRVPLSSCITGDFSRRTQLHEVSLSCKQCIPLTFLVNGFICIWWRSA